MAVGAATSLARNDYGKDSTMYGIKLLPICVMLVVVAGCRPKIDSGVAAQRLASYGRIAIVCLPGVGADPQYVDVVITQARMKAPSRLDFLETVDFPDNISVNAGATPPKLTLNQAVSAYDGVVTLVYSYSDGHVYLDMNMIDTKTGDSVWHHRMDKLDRDISRRLLAHGYWTPTLIKSFYGK
jgi:hypothetical protein